MRQYRFIIRTLLVFLLLSAGLVNQAWAAKVTYHILTLPIDPSVPGNYNYHMKDAVTGYRLEAVKVVVNDQTTVELPAHYKSPLATGFTYYEPKDITGHGSSAVSLYDGVSSRKGVLYQVNGVDNEKSAATVVAEGKTITTNTAEYYVVYTYNESNTIAKLDGSVNYNIGVKGKGFLSLNRGRNNRPAVIPTAKADAEMLASEDFSYVDLVGDKSGIATFWDNGKNKREDIESKFFFGFKFEGNDPYHIIVRTSYNRDITYIEKNEGTQDFVYKWYKGAALMTAGAGDKANAYLASDDHVQYTTPYNSSIDNPTNPASITKTGYFHGNNCYWSTVALLNNTTNDGYVLLGTRTVNGNGDVPTPSDGKYNYVSFNGYNNINFITITGETATKNHTMDGIYPIKRVTFKVKTKFYKEEGTADEKAAHTVSATANISQYTIDNDDIDDKFIPNELRRKYCTFTTTYRNSDGDVITKYSQMKSDGVIFLEYNVSESLPFKTITPAASYDANTWKAATWYELTDDGSTQADGKKLQGYQDGVNYKFKNNGDADDYAKTSEFAFIGDPYELLVVYRDATQAPANTTHVPYYVGVGTLSTGEDLTTNTTATAGYKWEMPDDATAGSFLLRNYKDANKGYWRWDTDHINETRTYATKSGQTISVTNSEAQTITLNITDFAGGDGHYFKITAAGTNPGQIDSSDPVLGTGMGAINGTSGTATITLKSSGDAAKSFKLSIQEYNLDNVAQGDPCDITINQGTTPYAGNNVEYSTEGATRIKLMPLPKFAYTYQVIDMSGAIAIKATVSQPIFTPLSGYDSIPEIIRSPFLADETVTYYSEYSGEGRGNLDSDDIIDEVPNVAANIFISYTLDNLSTKNIKLDDSQRFKVKLDEEYIYYDATEKKILSTLEPSTESSVSDYYSWKLLGQDPYAMLIENEGNHQYVKVHEGTWGDDKALDFDGTEANASRFIAMMGNYIGVYEVMAATGNTSYYHIGRPSTSGAETKVYSTTTYDHGAEELRFELAGEDAIIYHLIDKSNNELLDVSTYNPRLALPAEYVSPLVKTYYYYKSLDGAKDKTESDKITEITQDDDRNIYVTYDVNDLIGFNNSGRIDDHPYLLRFLQPFEEGYYLEDGNDKLTTTKLKAIYPYCNGDGNLNVYGERMRNEQMDGGSSTRSRWVWFFESANNDPYHVRLHSRNTIEIKSVKYPTYLQTSEVHFKQDTDPDAKHIVTGGALPGIASEQGTEYMILGTEGQYRLRTTNEIGGARRDVKTLEQYWKTYNMIKQHLLEIPSSADAYSTDPSTWVVPEDMRDDLETALETKGVGAGKWHSYDEYANAIRWNGYNDKSDGHAKRHPEKIEHWYQTFDMGNGTFNVETAVIPPVLVLLDRHGWEIMRLPLPDKTTYPYDTERQAALRAYDSPLVKEYKFYSNASKAYGSHKYALRLDDNKKERDQIKVDGAQYKSTSLANLPPITASGVLSSGVLNDQFVTYTVKDEYEDNYDYELTLDKASSTFTETGTSQPYLVLQHGRFYKTENSDNKSYISKPIIEHTRSGLGNVYDLIADPVNHGGTNADIIDGSGNWYQNNFWRVMPNLDIDEEMGIVWTSETDTTKLEPYTRYVTKEKYKNKTGFDPYNIQLQLINKNDGTPDGRFLTTHMTSTSIVNGAMMGGYNNLTAVNADDVDAQAKKLRKTGKCYFKQVDASNYWLVNVTKAYNGETDATYTKNSGSYSEEWAQQPYNITLEDKRDATNPTDANLFHSEGYDHSDIKMTNQTFMAVSDANGNMQLMPRFDHSLRVDLANTNPWETTLKVPKDNGKKASADDNSSMGSQTTFFVPARRYHYHIIDNDGLEAIRYKRGGDFYPAITDHFKSPIAKDFTYYKTAPTYDSGTNTLTVSDEITGSLAAAGLTAVDNDVYVRYSYDEDYDKDNDKILQGKWFTVDLAGKNLQSSGTTVTEDNPETTEIEEVPGTGVSLYAGNTTPAGNANDKPATINASTKKWQWKFLAAPIDPSSELHVSPDPYSVKLFNREANYCADMREPNPMKIPIKVPNETTGTDRFVLLSHPNGGYALAVARTDDTYTYKFLNGAAMTTPDAGTPHPATTYIENRQQITVSSEDYDTEKGKLPLAIDEEYYFKINNVAYKVVHVSGSTPGEPTSSSKDAWDAATGKYKKTAKDNADLSSQIAKLSGEDGENYYFKITSSSVTYKKVTVISGVATETDSNEAEWNTGTECFTNNTNALSPGTQLLVNNDVTHEYTYHVITNEKIVKQVIESVETNVNVGNKLAVSDTQTNEEAASHSFAPHLPEDIQTPLFNIGDYEYYGSATESSGTYTVVPNTKLFTLHGLYDDVVYVRYGAYSMDKTPFKVPNVRNATSETTVAKGEDSQDASLNIEGGLPYNIIWYDDNMMSTNEEDTQISPTEDHELDGDHKYVWYFTDNDPYALKIKHKLTGNYVNGTTTLTNEAGAKQFMLLKKSGYDYGILQVTGTTGGDAGKKLTGYGGALTSTNPEDENYEPKKFIIFGLSVHDLIYRLIIARTCTDSEKASPAANQYVDIPCKGETGNTKRIFGTSQRDLSTTYQLGETININDGTTTTSYDYCVDAGAVSIGDLLQVPNEFRRPNCSYEFYIDGVWDNYDSYTKTISGANATLNELHQGVKLNEESPRLMSDEKLINKVVRVNIVYSFDKTVATNNGMDFVKSTNDKCWYTFETPSGTTPYLAHYTNAWGLQSMEGRATRYTNDYLWTPVGDVYGFKLYNRYMIKNSDGSDKVMTFDGTISEGKNLAVAKPGSTVDTKTYTSGNEVFELLTGANPNSGYFRVHPVVNNSGTQYYVKRDASDSNYAKLSTTPSDWTFGLSMDLMAPYYERAGYVGGLKPEGKTAYETAVSSGTIMDIQHVVYNDANIITFTPGYYRLHNQPGVSGISPVRYASGYLHEIEKTAGDESTPIPMHFYSKVGVNTTFQGESGLESGFTLTDATRGEIPVPATEYDPSTIFYLNGSLDADNKTISTATMSTQGLNVSGNKMTTGEGTTFTLIDIGGATFLITDKLDPTTRNYFNFDQTSNIYDVKFAHNVPTDDAKWCLQPVQKTGTAGNGEMPLKITTNDGGDEYYYATFYAPYDVLLPADAGGKTYNAYVCKKWYDTGIHPVKVPAITTPSYDEGKFVPAGTPVIIRTNDDSEKMTLTLPSSGPTTITEENPLKENIFTGTYLEQLLPLDEGDKWLHDVYTLGLPFSSDMNRDGDYNTTGDIVAPLPEQAKNGVGFYINATSNKESNAMKANWARNNRYVLHNKIYYRESATSGPSARAMTRAVEFVPLIFDDLYEDNQNGDMVPSQTSVGDGCVYDMQGRRVANAEQVLDGTWKQRVAPGIYIINGKKVSIR